VSVALAPPSLSAAPWPQRRSQRLRWSLLLATALLALSCLVALSLGAFGLRLGEVVAALLARLGVPGAAAVDSRHELVLFAIRLPRVLVAVAVGATLSCAGAAMQGIFRNPLADPGLVGVTSGAALAASATIVLGGLFTQQLPESFRLFVLPVAAFAGALGSTALVWRFARREGRVTVLLLLLAGVAMNAMAGALTGLLTTVASDPQLRTLTFWSLGSLGGASWTMLGAFMPFALVSMLLLPALARPLNAILLGEAEARHLGVDVERLKKLVVVAAALAVGSAVAFVGSIGFVGLVGPHLARQLVGPDHRALFPLSAMLGALLLVLADLVARTVVAPAELPLGVVTGLLGTPFFLLLLARAARPGVTA
jgi:iron complex transport system permease protein